MFDHFTRQPQKGNRSAAKLVSQNNILPRRACLIQGSTPGGTRFVQGATPRGLRALGHVMMVPVILLGIMVPISRPGVTIDLAPVAGVALPPMLVPVTAARAVCCPPAPGPGPIDWGEEEHQCHNAEE
jgi:hypothetical protein